MAIVYVTTNKINGRKYLGKYSGESSNYFGSGVAIKRALLKYGSHNFSRKTLCVVELQEASRIERELSISWNVVNDKLWYNMKIGGHGGWDHISNAGRKHTPEQNLANSKRMLGNKHLLGHKCTELSKQASSKKNKGNKYSLGKQNAKGCSHSNESRQKQSEYMKNLPRIVCPHCNKSGHPHGMKRFHFNNCKEK